MAVEACFFSSLEFVGIVCFSKCKELYLVKCKTGTVELPSNFIPPQEY